MQFFSRHRLLTTGIVVLGVTGYLLTGRLTGQVGQPNTLRCDGMRVCVQTHLGYVTRCDSIALEQDCIADGGECFPTEYLGSCFNMPEGTSCASLGGHCVSQPMSYSAQCLLVVDPSQCSGDGGTTGSSQQDDDDASKQPPEECSSVRDCPQKDCYTDHRGYWCCPEAQVCTYEGTCLYGESCTVGSGNDGGQQSTTSRSSSKSVTSTLSVSSAATTTSVASATSISSQLSSRGYSFSYIDPNSNASTSSEESTTSEQSTISQADSQESLPVSSSPDEDSTPSRASVASTSSLHHAADECRQLCGNRICDADLGETASNCPGDCGGTCTAIEVWEECDDGNTAPGDGCSPECYTEGECSSSSLSIFIDSPDESSSSSSTPIDDSLSSSSSSSSEIGYSLPSCGNGVFEKGEQCEVGYATCTVGRTCDMSLCTCFHVEEQPLCGNDQIDGWEQCDGSSGFCADNRECDQDTCTCVPERSIPPACGDGRKDADEQCDDGNRLSNDGCSASCHIEEQQESYCGNGKFDLYEQCDRGIETCTRGWGCDYSTCTCFPQQDTGDCGNNRLDDGEQCDGSRDECAPNRVCNTELCTCVLPETVESSCGDGTLDSDEECDDGNLFVGDGCSSTCRLEMGCRSDLDCEGGVCLPDGSCTPCTIDAQCPGDLCVNSRCTPCSTSSCPGLLTCQKGTCQSTITLAASASICGNGVLDVREECDDSNRRSGDGCNERCLLEIGICGDGFVQTLLGEQCESSTHSVELPYGCLNCEFQSLSCNDGILDPGEECDLGVQNSTSPDARCRPNCRHARCGDGILDTAELCDDGNRLGGDGCDMYCQSDTAVAASTTVLQQGKHPFNAFAPDFARTQMQFPQYASYQQLPYQLPLAQLQPMLQGQAPVGDTGPAAVAVAGAGAAAGLSWIRRKRR